MQSREEIKTHCISLCLCVLVAKLGVPQSNRLPMNKDLVLREYPAIERTRLANERTLLTYIRTGLYFLVAGSTIGHFVETAFWNMMGVPMILVGVVITALGVARFIRVGRQIENSRKYVGNASMEFIRAIKGED